ncbi:MAG: hypothetical protein J3K34DRAFT_231632 [Monoraphidium minutum]|nr:MAG: hypothetical protein J3K34DRAFT_231632 [Monoraphidium minutum]
MPPPWRPRSHPKTRPQRLKPAPSPHHPSRPRPRRPRPSLRRGPRAGAPRPWPGAAPARARPSERMNNARLRLSSLWRRRPARAPAMESHFIKQQPAAGSLCCPALRGRLLSLPAGSAPRPPLPPRLTCAGRLARHAPLLWRNGGRPRAPSRDRAGAGATPPARGAHPPCARPQWALSGAPPGAPPPPRPLFQRFAPRRAAQRGEDT